MEEARSNEEEGTMKKERREGRSNEEKGARRKEPSLSDCRCTRMKRLKKKKKIVKVTKGRIVDRSVLFRLLLYLLIL